MFYIIIIVYIISLEGNKRSKILPSIADTNYWICDKTNNGEGVDVNIKAEEKV